MRARDLLEIFVDFLFRSLVMLVCIILCNKLFTVNHNIIKGIYIYKREKEEKLFCIQYWQCAMYFHLFQAPTLIFSVVPMLQFK